MTEERLPRDEGSLMSRLLEAGDRDEPSPKLVRRTLIATGVVSALSGATGTASATTTVGTIAILKWLGVGVIAGGSVSLGGGALVDGVRTRDTSSKGRAATAGLNSSKTTEMEVATVRSANEAPVEPPAEVTNDLPNRRSLTPRQGSSVPVPQPSASASTDTLIAEAVLIERASSAVRSRNGAQALSSLREYQSRFPRGRLYPEATVLEVEALLLQGQREAARDVARRFLQRHPESPSAKRLRSLTGLNE